MTIEEKAQRYDEAIEKLRSLHEDYDTVSTLIDVKEELENIFPELAESEDERIRKAIHIYLDWLDGRKDYAPKGEYTIKDMIAWLVRQSEHANFRNKIQIGDKVTRNEDGVLVNLSQLNRVAKKDEKQGEPTEINPSEFDLRLNKLLKQFESMPKEELASSLSFYLNVVQNNGTYKEEKQGEQETLCDKCRKAQPSHSCQDITALGRYALEKQGEQKPAEWSEENEKMFEHIIAKATLHFSSINYLDEEEINFLKSLRPQNTWKPSDEQMDALHYVTNFDYGGHKSTLVSLYEQLKELK